MQNGLLSGELLILPVCRMYEICRYPATWSVSCTGGDINLLLSRLSRHQIMDLSLSEPDLEEIFLHYYTEGDEKRNDNFQTRTAPGPLKPDHMTVSIAFLFAVCIFLFPEMKGEMDQVSDVFSTMGNFSAAFGMDQVSFGTLTGFLRC